MCWKNLLLYLDDNIIIIPDFRTHMQWLEDVFQRLHQAGLKLKTTKWKLLKKEGRCLGHIVRAFGASTNPEKIAAIRNLNELRYLCQAPASLTPLLSKRPRVHMWLPHMLMF